MRFRTVRTRRWLAYYAQLKAREASFSLRLRPSLIVIGAMKAGTSSLFRAIVSHPRVASPLRKEIKFFDVNWHRGSAWYWSHFPRLADYEGRITCEATTGYLTHPEAAARMESVLPDVKVVVLLRHPVERTISHYFHQRRVGDEPRGIREAIDARECDLLPMAALDPATGRLPGWYFRYAYVGRSQYAPQLRPWLERFGRDRVHVIISEEYFADPSASFSRVIDFAGLPPAVVDAGRVFNRGRREPVDRAIAAELWARCQTSIKELEELIGRRVPWQAP